MLEVSISLHNLAVALNAFALWAASAGIAALVFALCMRQPWRVSAAPAE